jgi:glycosyltransferase involved in cell wall biosynthesis
VPAYNAGPWIGRCLRSIRAQSVRDFRCIVLDDQSPDDTYDRARAAVRGDERFLVERASERRLAMGNTVEGVRRISTNDDDVIVHVDGDDWLAHGDVLAVLARHYEDPDVWLTYGSHRRWKDKLRHKLGIKRRRGIARAYPDVILRERLFRWYEFLASHLRTYRKFLWDGIDDADLRDEAGVYWRTGADFAAMIPMLEMAGPDHVRFVDEILYVYNNSNPLNDHRAAAEDQILTTCRIRQKPAYPLLDRAQR